jgi:hypothetical protein
MVVTERRQGFGAGQHERPLPARVHAVRQVVIRMPRVQFDHGGTGIEIEMEVLNERDHILRTQLVDPTRIELRERLLQSRTQRRRIGDLEPGLVRNTGRTGIDGPQNTHPACVLGMPPIS